METYLVHHGIKGQRWGIRRYQNEDGSWTEAGKKHRGLDIAKKVGKGVAVGAGVAAAGQAAVVGVAASKYHRAIGAPAYEKKELQAHSAALNKGRDAVGNIRQSRKDRKRADAQQEALNDAKNMTDEQLKKRTARLNLENNYVNAISQQQVNTGADTVDRILAGVGSALGIAASAVSIWALTRGK